MSTPHWRRLVALALLLLAVPALAQVVPTQSSAGSLSSFLIFSPDGTYDIGYDGSNYFRPRDVDAAEYVQAPSGIAAGALVLTSPCTPAQITSNQGAYSPGCAGVYQRWSTDASRTIDRLTISNAARGTISFVAGETHIIVNVGTQDIVLKHETGGVGITQNSRFHSTTGADVTLTADQQALVWYDSTTARWRLSKMN